MLSATGYSYTDNTGNYVDVISAFALYRGAAISSKSLPTGYQFLSAGVYKDLSDLFDPSFNLQDQNQYITNGTSYISKNHGIGGNDLKNVFRAIYITPTPSVTPGASVTPSPTPSASVPPTPSVTPPISVTPSISTTPGVSVTPPPSVSPPPSVTPSVTPSISYGIVTTVAVSSPSNLPSVIWSTATGGGPILLASSATANYNITNYYLQARSSANNPPSDGAYVTVYSTTPNSINSIISTTWYPNSGPGYYQFRAYVTVNGVNYYSADSAVVYVINNQIYIDISASPTTFSGSAPYSISLTSNASSNWGTTTLLTHGIQRSTDQVNWVDISGSPTHPNSQTDALILTDTISTAGTYYYQAYTTNTGLGYNYSSTIQVGAVQTYTATPINGDGGGLYTSINGDGTGNPIPLAPGTYSLVAAPLGGYFVAGYKLISGQCSINGNLLTAPGTFQSVGTIQGATDSSTITITQNVVISSVFNQIPAIQPTPQIPTGGGGGGVATIIDYFSGEIDPNPENPPPVITPTVTPDTTGTLQDLNKAVDNTINANNTVIDTNISQGFTDAANNLYNQLLNFSQLPDLSSVQDGVVIIGTPILASTTSDIANNQDAIDANIAAAQSAAQQDAIDSADLDAANAESAVATQEVADAQALALELAGANQIVNVSFQSPDGLGPTSNTVDYGDIAFPNSDGGTFMNDGGNPNNLGFGGDDSGSLFG